MSYFKYLDDGPPVALPFKAAGTINPGDPVKIGAGGTVTVNAADDTTSSGVALDTGSASGETIRVVPWSDRVAFIAPLTGTVGGGDLTTAAGQGTAGATLGAPNVRATGATLDALIGGFYSLEGSTGAWKIGLDDTGHDLLQLIGFSYNDGTGLWEGVALVNSASRTIGVTEV